MKMVPLGNTGMTVSELCFGVLPIGPLQKNVDVEEAGRIMAHALNNGVNFIDTAQLYKTYPHVRLALELSGKRPVISTKSTAASYEDMEAAIHQALNEMGIEHIDIMLLHAARRGPDLFETNAGALKCLMDYREKGILKSIGLSAHRPDLVIAGANHKEMDVIFPLLNKTGMGIMGGTLAEMESAVNLCFENGKAVFLMKALAGGTFLNDYVPAMEYARDFMKGRGPIALGMVSMNELLMNLKYFNGENIDEELSALPKSEKAFFILDFLCKACGKCVSGCHSDAITMAEKFAIIDSGKCLKCGYCVAECPEFAIRMK